MNDPHPKSKPAKAVIGLAELDQLTSQFEYLLDCQSRLCDELETIADQLPHTVDSQACLRTTQQLLPLIKMAHDFEEQKLFPLITAYKTESNSLSSTVERLRFEHWGDEEYALDVHNALREFVRVNEVSKIDSLAWMLRGFFEGMRRHLAFDREYLVPILNGAAKQMRAVAR